MSIWMVDDNAYATLDWHDYLLTTEVVPVAPYNLRNMDDALDIEYKVEDRSDEYDANVRLKYSTLDETDNRRMRVERTIESGEDCGPGTSTPDDVRSRPRDRR